MKLLLKLTSWQLFFTMVLLPILMYMFIGFLMSVFNLPSFSINVFWFFPLFSITIFFLWIWKAGIFLATCLPEGVSIKIKHFKMILAMPLVFWLGLIIVFAFDFILGFGDPNIFLFGIIGFSGLFILTKAFFVFAKLINTVKEQRELTKEEFRNDYYFLIRKPLWAMFDFQDVINEAYYLKEEGQWD